jgi:hypothetical protein
MKSNYYRYVRGVPNIPPPEAVVAIGNALTLTQIAECADPAEDSVLSISMQDMENRFCFPATPVERPKVIPKRRSKKRSKDNKDKKIPTGKRQPGETPRSESMVNFRHVGKK